MIKSSTFLVSNFFKLIILIIISQKYAISGVWNPLLENAKTRDTLSPNTLSFINKINSLDTSYNHTRFAQAWYEIRSKEEIDLILYDNQVKELIEGQNFSLEKTKRRIARRLCRSIPLGLASQYYNWLNLCQNGQQSDAKKSARVKDSILKCIKDSGNGTFENPYDIFCFYDAYFFIVSEFGIPPEKGTFFKYTDNVVLGVYEVFIKKEGLHYTIYFDLNNLGTYYRNQIETYEKLR